MIITIIVFIAILFILVVVHELGHFISARIFGVRVDEFGFGLPPRIAGIRRKGVLWSINWLPFGGFVKIKGEDGENNQDHDSLSNKKIWKRCIVLSSGVFVNLILAWLLIVIGAMIGWPQNIYPDQHVPQEYISQRESYVVFVEEASPAEEASLMAGDTILKVNGVSYGTLDELYAYLNDTTIKEFNFLVERGKERVALDIIRERDGKLGIAMREFGLVKYPFFTAIKEGTKKTGELMQSIIRAIYGVFRDLFLGKGISPDIAGPVGIAQATGRVVNLGLLHLIQFIALLSLNLSIINFIPFPALDGGRVLFLLIAKVKGRNISQKVEGVFHTVGLWILLILVALITIRDLMHLDRFG